MGEARLEHLRESIRDLADHQAIANTLALHSRGVDRADYALLRSAYADDAAVAYGFFEGDADTFCRILAGAQAAGAVTLHRTSNMWIRLEGDAARSESYVVVYTEGAEGEAPVQRLIGGRYLDRHVRTATGWRLAHRTYVLDWNINRPSTVAWPDSPADPARLAPRGGHGRADPARTLLALWTAGAARAPSHSQGAPMASDDLERSLDAALSRQAIHDLVMAYCRAVDRGDEALFRSVFHPDAVMVAGGLNGPVAEIAADAIAGVRGGLKSSFHALANEWVQVNGDTAVGESYVTAYTLAVEGAEAVQAVLGGRYLDSFERREGVWKIARRVFVMDFNINQPSTAMFGEGMYAALTTRGGYMPDDPIHGFWPA